MTESIDCDKDRPMEHHVREVSWFFSENLPRTMLNSEAGFITFDRVMCLPLDILRIESRVVYHCRTFWISWFFPSVLTRGLIAGTRSTSRGDFVTGKTNPTRVAGVFGKSHMFPPTFGLSNITQTTKASCWGNCHLRGKYFFFVFTCALLNYIY